LALASCFPARNSLCRLHLPPLRALRTRPGPVEGPNEKPGRNGKARPSRKASRV